MNIRAQVSMVFHLDKCIGCHTCTVACKNIWTDRKGTEYMWWNNVETKPGTGYPYKWEDQKKYRGGWKIEKGQLKLNLASRTGVLARIFHNPVLPQLDDYYEPWTYKYEDVVISPEQDIQPTARPISMITGKPLDVKYGPNWDDDLSGSEEYAAKDVNLDELTPEEREQLKEIERTVFFYLPRICNHCVNASCVASCPSGAIYKRGEDGIVLVSQEKCRGWRMCISGCPYKKVYYNWSTGKSEKCILCYPRLESGQAPACFHTCVGRIRYLGVILYDADGIVDAAKASDENLVAAQLDLIKDPFDPEVIAAAKENGISDAMIEAAQNSPVYKFVKKWGIALPLHPEFRTMPMLFYVPPLLPVLGKTQGETYDINETEYDKLAPMLSTLEQARVPIKFMASLFTAGNEELIKEVYRKLIAVRAYMRAKTVADESLDETIEALSSHGLTVKEADLLVQMTTRPTYEERFVVPPLAREVGIEMLEDPLLFRQETGFGFTKKAKRTW